MENDALTVEKLMNVIATVDPLPYLAFTVTPAFMSGLKNWIHQEEKKAAQENPTAAYYQRESFSKGQFHFDGTPIFTVQTQDNPCIQWSDRAAMEAI